MITRGTGWGSPTRFSTGCASAAFGLSGQRIVDLATGTGTVARGLARRGASVLGLDRFAAMVKEAAHTGQRGRDAHSLRRRQGRGDRLRIGTVRCRHRRAKLALVRRAAGLYHGPRLLKPGGRLVIAHFDWLPLPGTVVEATERLIERLSRTKDNGEFLSTLTKEM